jgi:hypothetical protein
VSYATDHPTKCRGKECTASVPGSKWARVKATAEQGWIFLKSGEAYCPDHLPDWMGPWRARKAEAAGKRLPRCGMKTGNPERSLT